MKNIFLRLAVFLIITWFTKNQAQTAFQRLAAHLTSARWSEWARLTGKTGMPLLLGSGCPPRWAPSCRRIPSDCGCMRLVWCILEMKCHCTAARSAGTTWPDRGGCISPPAVNTCALSTVWQGLAAMQFDWVVCGWNESPRGCVPCWTCQTHPLNYSEKAKLLASLSSPSRSSCFGRTWEWEWFWLLSNSLAPYSKNQFLRTNFFHHAKWWCPPVLEKYLLRLMDFCRCFGVNSPDIYAEIQVSVLVRIRLLSVLNTSWIMVYIQCIHNHLPTVRQYDKEITASRK